MMTYVYLVTKCTDFAEGNGPYLPHKVFSTLELAREYVKQKDGIYGSKQELLRYGPQVPYVTECWNGYNIVEMVVRTETFDRGEVTRRMAVIEKYAKEYETLKKLLED